MAFVASIENTFLVVKESDSGSTRRVRSESAASRCLQQDEYECGIVLQTQLYVERITASFLETNVFRRVYMPFPASPGALLAKQASELALGEALQEVGSARCSSECDAELSSAPRLSEEACSSQVSPRSFSAPSDQAASEVASEKLLHVGSSNSLSTATMDSFRSTDSEDGDFGSSHLRHCDRVPKTVDLAQEFEKRGDASLTTLMLRNIPNRLSPHGLIKKLNSIGFSGTYDFLYIPLDLRTMCNVGYAFVNFADPFNASECMGLLQDGQFRRGGRMLEVCHAHIQGLDANLKHYEKTVVGKSSLKQRRPVVFANGVEVQPAEGEGGHERARSRPQFATSRRG